MARDSVLYLHGWGGHYPAECPIAHALQRLLSDAPVALHMPTFHPGGKVKETRVERFLVDLAEEARHQPNGRFAAVVGCSFGGLLAALFQERFPEFVGRMVLLAPAIDNFARNYEGVPEAERRMPEVFVKELSSLPARPTIKVPTTLLHGLLDNDDGGSALWRVREWAAAERFSAAHFPEGVDHSLEPWLSTPTAAPDAPPLEAMLQWALEPVQERGLQAACRRDGEAAPEGLARRARCHRMWDGVRAS
uniref:AB hydrolase-1 domain-containing protein n=1 Tax=Alexandrium monilatum TaxID=311494 RepID=A0A7S4RVL3_9DINO